LACITTRADCAAGAANAEWGGWHHGMFGMSGLPKPVYVIQTMDDSFFYPAAANYLTNIIAAAEDRRDRQRRMFLTVARVAAGQELPAGGVQQAAALAA
jgi:hypothetical protein